MPGHTTSVVLDASALLADVVELTRRGLLGGAIAVEPFTTATALTADHAWTRLSLDVHVHLIRESRAHSR